MYFGDEAKFNELQVSSFESWKNIKWKNFIPRWHEQTGNQKCTGQHSETRRPIKAVVIWQAWLSVCTEKGWFLSIELTNWEDCRSMNTDGMVGRDSATYPILLKGEMRRGRDLWCWQLVRLWIFQPKARKRRLESVLIGGAQIFKKKSVRCVKLEEGILTWSSIRVNTFLFSQNKDMLRKEKHIMLKVVKLPVEGRKVWNERWLAR